MGCVNFHSAVQGKDSFLHAGQPHTGMRIFIQTERIGHGSSVIRNDQLIETRVLKQENLHSVRIAVADCVIDSFFNDCQEMIGHGLGNLADVIVQMNVRMGNMVNKAFYGGAQVQPRII